MATISFGSDWKRDAHEIKSYVTVETIKSFLINYENRCEPREWSVYDAECMERIADKIRKYYKQPRMTPEEEEKFGL